MEARLRRARWGDPASSPDTLAELAERHLQAGNVPQAAQLLRALSEAHGENVLALRLWAVLALQTGDAATAVQFARRAVKLRPRSAACQSVLGRALRAVGRAEEAATAFRSAVRAEPVEADHHVHLGLALRAAGRPAEAAAAYRRALELRPADALAHHNLANVLLAQGDGAGARRHYRRALALAPGFAQSHFELGNLSLAEGAAAEAADHYQAAVAARPDYGPAWLALGRLRLQQGDEPGALAALRRAGEQGEADAWLDSADLIAPRGPREEAILCLRRGLALLPDNVPALRQLAALLQEKGELEEALACLGRAVALAPRQSELHFAQGVVQHLLSQWGAAIESYRCALALEPGMALAYANLAGACKGQGRIEEGFAAARRALELDPALPQAHNNLAMLHLDMAEAEQAMECLRRALALDPGYGPGRSNLCMAANYAGHLGAEQVFRIHVGYGQQFALTGSGEFASRPRETGRRLRIGYVSPDLRRHSVASFIEPVLAAHDRGSFGITAYYNHPAEDAVSARLQGYCDRWVNAVGLPDDELARCIHDDGIDILVDLAGHTAGGRLPVFARRPAPVQIGWIGYLATSGLAAMDWRVTDDRVDPPGYEAHASERPLRLPGCYLCYQPPPGAPEPGPLPARSAGYVTFGSFNNLAKMGPETVALWASVLRAVPEAMLLLKSRALSDPWAREQVIARFEAQGVAAERLELAGWQADDGDHLGRYRRVDIALDTWPYNGVTTTCEALWMGVPVVSRTGPTHAARQGLSLLHAMGMEELALEDPARYVEACAALAADLDRLAALRAGLRARMAASPLLDAGSFTARLEAAYRQLAAQR